MIIKHSFLHTETQVLEKIKSALVSGNSLSLARFGNGEAIAMAQRVLISDQQIPFWVEYAGVKLPNEQVRQDLLTAIREADIVGLTTDYKNWDCAPLLEKVLTTCQIAPKYLTDGAINWKLHKTRDFYRLLNRFPVVLVGRLAPKASLHLSRKGLNIVNTVVLEDYSDLPKVENSLLSGPYFRVALVAAGIPATILCPRLAKKANCVAIDYGHVINDLLKPGFSNKDLPAETERWLQQRQK